MSRNSKISHYSLTNGYSTEICDQYDLNIPSEIIKLIFMFYYTNTFHFEYGQHIKIDDNIITNISDSWEKCLNTTVIGQWMKPESQSMYIHVIKVKIIKKKGWNCPVAIGIVKEGYDVNNAILGNESYWIGSGIRSYNKNKKELTIDRIEEGDIVSLTLDFKHLSLKYDIINDNKENRTKSGIAIKSGRIDKVKYKWAVWIDQKLDSCQIIDIFSYS